MQRLKELWDSFSQRLGLSVAFSSGVWQLLTAMYKVPPRSYHSLEWHILQMLDDFHDFKKDFPNYTDLWDEIEWAIWFHDIYQTHSGKDEQLSAKLAVSLAESHTNLWVYPVHQIIISTTHCLNPRVGYTSAETLTPEQKIMCDLDLAGFVAPEDVFREAQKRIRAEYPTVGDEDYKENRKLFMGKLLGRGYVFLTEEFEPAEENARKRIEGIIKGEYD